MGVLVAVALPFGSVVHGQSAPERKNKVLVYPVGAETVSQLEEHGIDRVEDCGSCWSVKVTDDQEASQRASHSVRVVRADFLNKVEQSVV